MLGLSVSRTTRRSDSSTLRTSSPASASWLTSVLMVLGASSRSSAASVIDRPGRRETTRTNSSWAPVTRDNSTGRPAWRRPLRRIEAMVACNSAARAAWPEAPRPSGRPLSVPPAAAERCGNPVTDIMPSC